MSEARDTMDEVKIGIVGMGGRGRGWINTLKLVPYCRLTAVCDRIGPLVEQGLERAEDPDVRGFRDYDEMLAEADMDAVAVIAEPEALAELSVRALEAGKHAIAEVPMCYEMDDVWRLVTTVERTGLKFELAEQVAWSPWVFAWRDMIERGELGKVLLAEGQYLHGMPDYVLWVDSETGRKMGSEEAKGNPKAVRSRYCNLGSPIKYHTHDLSPLLRVLDDRVKRVFCMGTRREASYYHEFLSGSDLQVALMHTEKDTVIRLVCGFNFPTAQPAHWYHLVGTGGDMETARTGTGARDDPGAWWLAGRYMQTRVPVMWGHTAFQPVPAAALASGHGGLDYYPAEDFVNCIINDTEPFNNIYRAAEVQAPGILAGASAETGEQIEVPDFRPNETRKAGELPQTSA